MATKVMSCTCANTQQDAIHGTNMRVFNETGGKSSKGWRCTSCGTAKVSAVSTSSIVKKK